MFPIFEVKIEGLNNTSFYHIDLEFEPIDKFRYKYQPNSPSEKAHWISTNQLEDTSTTHLVYSHSSCPQSGNYWMSGPVSFKG